MESIQHFSHSQHPLILIKKVGDKKEEFVCYGCQKSITDEDDYYACEEGSTECSFYLHKICADLPRNIDLPIHEHPLTLLARPTYYGSSCCCNICQRSDWKWFSYHCSLCDFDVDILCASLLLQEKQGNNFLEHEGHPQHPLTSHLRSSLFHCDACYTKEEDLSYFCNTCQFWIHKSCASMPKSITVAHHDDPLYLAYSLPPKYRKFIQFCDICREKVEPSSWVYYCDNCRYFNHLKCATATSKLSNTSSLTIGEGETQAEEGDEESNDQLMQFPLPNHESLDPICQFVANNSISGAYGNGETELNRRLHKHQLSIHNDADGTINNMAYNEILCDGCVRPISVPFYSCSECNFFLHRFCAELPQKLHCPHDPRHTIKVKLHGHCYDFFQCSFCSKYSNGFSCWCESCTLGLDIGCASSLFPSRIKHDSHGHALVRSHLPKGEQKLKCNSCSKHTGSSQTFSCKACSFNLCARCVNYPGSVRHEYDKHPIPLRYPPIKDHPSDFICEICEEDINPRYWLYHCHDCNQSFHTYCLSPYDWYSNVKFGGTVNINNIHHQNPLTFVRNSKSKYESLCDQCGEDYNGIPILECTPCRFKLCSSCARKNR